MDQEKSSDNSTPIEIRLIFTKEGFISHETQGQLTQVMFLAAKQYLQDIADEARFRALSNISVSIAKSQQEMLEVFLRLIVENSQNEHRTRNSSSNSDVSVLLPVICEGPDESKKMGH